MLAVQLDTVSKLFSEAISHLFSDSYRTKSVSICIDHFQLREFFPQRKGDIPSLKGKFHNVGSSKRLFKRIDTWNLLWIKPKDNWNLLSIKPINYPFR